MTAPCKVKSTGRIDPIVALIMAIALSIKQPAEPEECVYETRGLLTL